MISDDQVLVDEDLYILDRIKEFLSHPEVFSSPAAKNVMNIIERKASGHIFTLKINSYHARSSETRWSKTIDCDSSDIFPSSAYHTEGHEQRTLKDT